ncbi:hypothetical protein ACFLY2_02935 [Patescibacteria group bacterium]
MLNHSLLSIFSSLHGTHETTFIISFICSDFIQSAIKTQTAANMF